MKSTMTTDKIMKLVRDYGFLCFYNGFANDSIDICNKIRAAIDDLIKENEDLGKKNTALLNEDATIIGNMTEKIKDGDKILKICNNLREEWKNLACKNNCPKCGNNNFRFFQTAISNDSTNTSPVLYMTKIICNSCNSVISTTTEYQK